MNYSIIFAEDNEYQYNIIDMFNGKIVHDTFHKIDKIKKDIVNNSKNNETAQSDSLDSWHADSPHRHEKISTKRQCKGYKNDNEGSQAISSQYGWKDNPNLGHDTSKLDVIYMRNKDTNQCKVFGDEFALQTAYGQIKIPRPYVGSIHLEGERKNLETVITISGGRFSGFLINPTFKVDIQGNILSIRKEKIAKIEFARIAEPGPVKPDLLEMRNTDSFRGLVKTPKFIIETSYGTLKIDKDKIERIDFEGDDRIIGKVILRDNRGVLQGTLKNEDISIETDFGQEISVYSDKIQKIVFGDVKGLVSPKYPAAPGKVFFPGEEPSSMELGEPVSGRYALVLNKARGGSSVSLAVAVSINGRHVGRFINNSVRYIEKYLRTGVNKITIKAEPIVGSTGNNYLNIKLGPVVKVTQKSPW